MKIFCSLCPRRCALEEGQTGFCRARGNRNGEIVCLNYARVTALALDPIEKKPLRRFFPGSRILSAGSYGCNLACPFCQNHAISMADETSVPWREILPEALVGEAEAHRSEGNIGLAFTYNEPLIGYEYVRDCARLCKGKGLKVVLVTNGSILPDPWIALLPLVDAANIDLKCFTPEGYRALGGDLETVKTAISLAAGRIHLEVTTLVVPRFNDGEEEMRALAGWLAGLGSDVPLHISRFFPQYRMLDRPPTSVETIMRLSVVAGEYLPHVYRGNC